MRRECRERFPPAPQFSDPDMHHGTCVTHVPWFMPGSLNSGFLRSRWRGKRSRHSRRMRNPRNCVSGKRPMDRWTDGLTHCKLEVNSIVPRPELSAEDQGQPELLTTAEDGGVIFILVGTMFPAIVPKMPIRLRHSKFTAVRRDYKR